MYRDTRGKRTIGVGFNLHRRDAKTRLRLVGAKPADIISGRKPLSEHQINVLFTADVKDAMVDARRMVVGLNFMPHRVQLIVIDMVFNLGAGRDDKGFAGFNAFRRSLERFDFQSAAAELRSSAWYNQTGNRAIHHVSTLLDVAADWP